MNIQTAPHFFSSLLRVGRRWERKIRTFNDESRAIEGEMFRRLRERHRIFWTAPDADELVHSTLTANESLEVWQQPRHWQRRLSNKHNAREFAQLLGCRVPQLYWHGSNPDSCDWSSLPDHYVIRPTCGHSCHGVYVMSNGVNLMDGKDYTFDQLRLSLMKDQRANPRIEFLFEEFVRSEEGQYGLQKDYKLFTFAGEIACIQVIRRAGPGKGSSRYFDVNWNALPPISAVYPPDAVDDPPRCFSEMLAHARTLSRAYGLFVRLDFYATSAGAVLGEFTPTPGGGRSFTKYGDRLMITHWDRFCPGLI